MSKRCAQEARLAEVRLLTQRSLSLPQVPMDQPVNMLDLFGDFVHGRLFDNTPKAEESTRPRKAHGGGRIAWKRAQVTQ